MNSSYPGSKYIDRITFQNLSYLTDTSKSSIDSADFNILTGKPLNNIVGDSTINPFFINLLNNTLVDGVNINDDFIYLYPQMLEINNLRDIPITEETDINAVFIAANTTQKNMFGYYFYTVDNDGNKRILDNNDDNLTGNYYKPTVIFPNTDSILNDSSTLQTGNSRKLKGNLPNGKFFNITVGFFIIVDGWVSFLTNTTGQNDNFLYSTCDFNQKCQKSNYRMINNKIYSVFLRTQNDLGEELLTVCFENVFDLTKDNKLDYKDCCIGLSISNIDKDYDKFATCSPSSPILSTNSDNCNIIYYDDTSEYVKFNSKYNLQNMDYIFERHLEFYDVNKRDNYYTAYSNMLTDYVTECIKIDESPAYKIVVTYHFRENDMSTSYDNENNSVLTLIRISFNNNVYTSHYAEVVELNLNDPNYRECYRLHERDSCKIIINFTDTISPPKKIMNKRDNFRILGSGIVDSVNGPAYLPSSIPGMYQVYKNVANDNTGLTINVKMDTYPNYHKSEIKTFVRYISFIVDDNPNNHVVIDLCDLTVYTCSNQNLIKLSDFSSLNNIDIGDIVRGSSSIEQLIPIFKNDINASYRIISVKDTMMFYCIRLTTVEDNPSMIFLDKSVVLNWSNTTNVLGGIYYNKHKLSFVNSLNSL